MEETKWYLRKAHDGSEFGPVTFQQLFEWATDAQISPLDRVSTDGETWMKAPMVPELEMDYMVEVGEDQFYGPTTVGALREFLAAGEVTLDSVITNCRDGTEMALSDLVTPVERTESGPARSGGIRFNLQERIRELEKRVDQERRAREAAEALVHKLEAKLAILGHEV